MTDEIRAEPGSLSVGDMVTWNSSGGSASGKITRIATDGTLGVPDSSFSVTGTPDDPAALIRVYRDNEPSETIVGHKFSTLNKQRASAGVDMSVWTPSAMGTPPHLMRPSSSAATTL